MIFVGLGVAAHQLNLCVPSVSEARRIHDQTRQSAGFSRTRK